MGTRLALVVSLGSLVSEGVRRSLALLASVGSLMLEARPTQLMALMTAKLRSNCHHSRPVQADHSKAWWLLCHSPRDSRATQTQFLDLHPNHPSER